MSATKLINFFAAFVLSFRDKRVHDNFSSGWRECVVDCRFTTPDSREIHGHVETVKSIRSPYIAKYIVRSVIHLLCVCVYNYFVMSASTKSADECPSPISKRRSRCIVLVTKYLPVLGWLPRYNRLEAVSDIIAGITLGLTMIPQSIAYAALAGLTAQVGYLLYLLSCHSRNWSGEPQLAASCCKVIPPSSYFSVWPVLLLRGRFSIHRLWDYKGSLDRSVVSDGTYNAAIHKEHAVGLHGAPVLPGWMHGIFNGHIKFRLVSQSRSTRFS